ncbi:hypothetical protein R1sor_014127 [Riccia sorocarpa]|uniref:Endonuclease/exonuclease/phosphatase domain-containing protein n=1 Tax=Riccia sorocarpa TaxID=122646 RepID=A0ABD3H937_9MARC
MAAVEGGREIWAKSDVIVILETWEEAEAAVVELPGFTRIASLWNKKRFVKGRGYGGLAVWIREKLLLEVTVCFADPKKQFICLRLSNGDAPTFLVAAYFAPVWHFLSGAALARSSNMEDSWLRVSEDRGRNSMGEPFLRLATTCGLTVINGTSRFPDTGCFTCITSNGASVVDYLLATGEARERIESFEFGELAPESDHRPLVFSISGFQRGRSLSKRQRTVWHVDKTQCGKYERILDTQLQPGLRPTEISTLIRNTARAVLVRPAPVRKPWYDESCWRERQKAMLSPTDDKSVAFRTYRNFIKSKKRRFIREQQLLMTKELERDPQSFWSRFRAKKVDTELQPTDLMSTTRVIPIMHCKSRGLVGGTLTFAAGHLGGISLSTNGGKDRSAID